MPEVGSGFIGFDDAAVVGVGDEGVAVGEPAGKGHTAEGYTASLCVRVHDSAWSGVRDFKGLVVVLVGDEDVSSGEQFCGVGIVESVVLPHDDFIGATHLDDATVSLIAMLCGAIGALGSENVTAGFELPIRKSWKPRNLDC